MSEWFYFILWENAFMNAWFFLNAYIVYVWMILFYFMRKCIYEILDFFFLKIHLWMDDFFCGFIFIFFSYVYMHNIFWECTYKWNFLECVYDVRNSRKVYKRFCECIRRYSQVDFVPLKIQAWKSIFYFLSNFPFFL